MLNSLFWNSKFYIQIRNQRPQKLSPTEFHPKQVYFAFWSVILDPPFSISEFRIQMRNQRPQKPPSTDFHPKDVTFCIFIGHIKSSILNVPILTSNSGSETQKILQDTWYFRLESKKALGAHGGQVLVPRNIALMPTKGLITFRHY